MAIGIPAKERTMDAEDRPLIATSINLVNQTMRDQENGTETVIPGTTKREM
jgi:hypothetical protein